MPRVRDPVSHCERGVTSAPVQIISRGLAGDIRTPAMAHLTTGRAWLSRTYDAEDEVEPDDSVVDVPAGCATGLSAALASRGWQLA